MRRYLQGLKRRELEPSRCSYSQQELSLLFSGNQLCKVNNGGCSHLCLLTPGGYQCSCPHGLSLDTTGTKCVTGNNDESFDCLHGTLALIKTCSIFECKSAALTYQMEKENYSQERSSWPWVCSRKAFIVTSNASTKSGTVKFEKTCIRVS